MQTIFDIKILYSTVEAKKNNENKTKRFGTNKESLVGKIV